MGNTLYYPTHIHKQMGNPYPPQTIGVWVRVRVLGTQWHLDLARSVLRGDGLRGPRRARGAPRWGRADVDPGGATLLEFFRTGCGMCVVLLSTYDAASGAVSHAAASSCLTLVHGLHHSANTTTVQTPPLRGSTAATPCTSSSWGGHVPRRRARGRGGQGREEAASARGARLAQGGRGGGAERAVAGNFQTVCRCAVARRPDQIEGWTGSL